MKKNYPHFVVALKNKKFSFKLFFLTCVIGAMITPTSKIFSQTTVTWAATSSPGNGVVSPANANFTPTAVTKGSNLSGTATFTANGYGTLGSGSNKGWSETSLSNAVTNNAYIEYSVTLNCAVTYTINSITFTTRTSSSTTNITTGGSDLRYSTDNFASFTSLGGFTATSSAVNQSYSPSITVLEGKTIKFRLYASGLSAINSVLNVLNFKLSGTVAFTTPTISPTTAVCVNSSGNVYTTEAGMTNYVWTVTGGTITAGGASTDNTATVTWNTAGTGHVIVTYTRSTGCSVQKDQSITVNPNASITLASGSDNQTVCVQTKANGNGMTISPIAPIVYNTTNATGATLSGNPPGVSGSFNSGTGKFTISGTPTVTGNFTYTVTTTGASCAATATGTIKIFTGAGTLDPIRNGGRCGAKIDGSPVFCPDGTPATYLWYQTENGNGVTTLVQDSVREDLLPAGDATRYKYTRVAICGSCRDSIQMNQPVAAYMSITTTQTNVSCFGGSDGSITATVGGGISPFRYQWSNGLSTGPTTSTSDVNSGLVAGTYSLTLKDSANCNTNTSVTITQPGSLPSGAISGGAIVCQNDPSPNIVFSGSGGTAPYTFTYNINGNLPPTTKTGNPLNEPAPTNVPGTYVYNLTGFTDSKGCLPSTAASGSATVVVNPLPTVTISGSSSATPCYGTTGTVTLTGTPGATVTYTVNGVTQPTITLDASGNYTITTTAITGTTTYALTNVKNSSTLCSTTPTAPTSVTFSVNTGSFVWTGLVSSNWNTIGNWCSGIIPTSTDNVTIPAGTPFSPVISTANANANSVTIANGATLTMAGAFNLSITGGGSFTNNGTFTGAASTGAVIFAGAGVVNGTAATTFENITSNGALNLTTLPVINGIFTINNSAAVVSGTPTYTGNSTLKYNTGAAYTTGAEWNAGAAGTIAAGAGIPQNVTIQNGIITIPDALGANRALAGNLTINAGATLQMTAGTRDLYVLGNWTNIGGTFNANGRTVDFNATSATPKTQTIAGTTTFYNLTFGNTNITTDFGTSTTTVTNQFNNNDGTMNGSTSKVILTGSGPGTIIGGAAKNFYDLQINSGAVINHISGGGNIHIDNSFVNNGSLTENAGYTFYFDKSAATESFTGTGTTSFGSLTIGTTAGIGSATTLNANANFSVTGGSMTFFHSSVYNGTNNTATFSTNAATISGSGSANFYNALTSVALNPGSGISTFNNTLQLDPGGSIVNNSPNYGAASTLIYNTTTASLLTSLEWIGNGASVAVGEPFNVTIQNSNNVVIAGDRTIPGTLNIGSINKLDLNNYTLTVNTSVSGAGSLTGSVLSGLTLGGSAPSLKFTSGGFNNYLKTFTITVGGSASLASDLNITATNGVLTANGPLDANGLLTLKSGALGDARVGFSIGGINGEVTVERYIPARRAWRFLTVPFKSTNQSVNAAWQEGFTNTSLVCPPTELSPIGLGTQICYINGYPGYDYHNTGKPSLQYWNGTGWSAPTSTLTTKLTDYPAWYVFIRGDRQICLDGINGEDQTVIRAKGTLNQIGDGVNSRKQATPSGIANYYMVGNPYASPVKLQDVISGPRVSGFQADKIWVMDPRVGGTFGVGGFVTYTTGIGWVPNDPTRTTASYAVGDPPVLQSGQGFMVYTTSTNPQVEFREVDKDVIQWNVFGATARNTQAVRYPAIFMNLMLQDSTTVTDGVAAAFNADFSAGVDEKDVQKLWNLGENIALIRGDKSLSAEKRPFVTGSDTLFYRLYLRQQPYVLKLFSSDFNQQLLPDEAWLVDKYLGTQTKVDLTKETFYNFVPNKDTNSYRDRFMMVFNRTLKPGNPSVVDGSMSQVKARIYPNPVSGKTFKIILENAQKGHYSINIYTAGGKLAATRKISYEYGQDTYTITVPATVTAGTYIVQITKGKGEAVGSVPLIISR